MHRWLFAVVGLAAASAHARPITLHVFDADSRAPVAGAVCSVGLSSVGVTDARGELAIDVDGGTAWVRVPEGFAPGPVGAVLDGKTDPRVDLPLHHLAAPVTQPFTFVAASDLHSSHETPFWADLGDAALAATARSPAFFTLLGDITGNALAKQLELVDAQLAGIGVPFVPVPGNHDWYDNGVAWRARYGTDNYSFDLGGVHFVVWNMWLPDLQVAKLFESDLAGIPRDATVVGMTHAPLSADLAARLRDLGVDYVLSGHTHTNRVIDHDGLIELNTEPFLMGGLDYTPAGYRVLTVDHGKLTGEHRTTVDHPRITVTSPAPGTCVPPGGAPLLVSTPLAGGTVTARIDCGPPFPLTFAGGWTWRADLPALPAGPHALALDARGDTGDRATATIGFETCDPPVAESRVRPNWPQLGGGPAHTGASPREVAPPLVARWTAAVGGHVMTGAPAIADGAVFVTTTDLAGADGGGIVALDLATGAVRWRAQAELPIRGAATVAAGIVAAVQVDGTVLAFDAQTGAPAWHYELGEGLTPQAAATYGSIAADGDDLVIGNQRRLATIDARTGRALWLRDPVRGQSQFPSLSTIAIGDGIAVGVFDRELGGVLAWDRTSADLLWQLSSDLSLSINASPVIGGGLVYLSTGATDVVALNLASGTQRWRTRLDYTGYDWAIATIGTPALARGVLVVPTLWRDLVGLDAASGRVLWRFRASGAAPLRTTHYRGAGEPGWAASPVVTGDIAWAADTGGHLVALDVHSGAVLWRDDLDVPVLAGLATTGDALVVASYDGTVRLLAPGTPGPAISVAACDAPRTGCCDARSGGGGSALLAVGLAYALRRRRRNTSASGSSAAPSPAGPPASHA